MNFSQDQADAIQKFSKWFARSQGIRDPEPFHLRGYAGTGKTSCAKTMASIAQRPLYLAPTGKAVTRLIAKGCDPAKTLHSAIFRASDPDSSWMERVEAEIAELDTKLRSWKSTEIEDGAKREALAAMLLAKRKELPYAIKKAKQPRFSKNEDSEVLSHDLVLVDEASMLGEYEATNLLSYGVPVLTLGDDGQLPPVGGAGYFMNQDADAELTTIHRQADGNPILDLATLVRMGEPLEVGRYGQSRVCRVRDLTPGIGLEYEQIIVGKNETRFIYNRRMRELRGFTSIYPTAGDRLLCRRNVHEEGLLNGEQFYCTESAEPVPGNERFIRMKVAPAGGGEQREVKAHAFYFDNYTVPKKDRVEKEKLPWYLLKDASEWDFGYAITCHASQGSEWSSVLVFDEGHSFPQANKWRYTAMSRAAEKVLWVLP